MGEKIEFEEGKLFISGQEFGPTKLSSFECNMDEVFEEHRDELFTFKSLGNAAEEASLTFEMIFNTELFYKVTGMWDWICENCPNRKVVHLINHAKKKRVRKKNFKRALHIVGELLYKE